MSRKNQEILKIHGKLVYKVIFGISWSIVIMPDNIIIDNYHNKPPHVHPDNEKHYKKIYIANTNLNVIYSIVYNHIDKNKYLILDELIKELKIE